MENDGNIRIGLLGGEKRSPVKISSFFINKQDEENTELFFNKLTQFFSFMESNANNHTQIVEEAITNLDKNLTDTLAQCRKCLKDIAGDTQFRQGNTKLKILFTKQLESFLDSFRSGRRTRISLLSSAKKSLPNTKTLEGELQKVIESLSTDNLYEVFVRLFGNKTNMVADTKDCKVCGKYSFVVEVDRDCSYCLANECVCSEVCLNCIALAYKDDKSGTCNIMCPECKAEICLDDMKFTYRKAKEERRNDSGKRKYSEPPSEEPPMKQNKVLTDEEMEEYFPKSPVLAPDSPIDEQGDEIEDQ